MGALGCLRFLIGHREFSSALDGLKEKKNLCEANASRTL
jgi:hypothetical protein